MSNQGVYKYLRHVSGISDCCDQQDPPEPITHDAEVRIGQMKSDFTRSIETC